MKSVSSFRASNRSFVKKEQKLKKKGSVQMKDIFSKRQRFSLRKLTIGVCSVLLGTTIFCTNAVAAEEVTATAAEAK